jgi:hypothetical protein
VPLVARIPVADTGLFITMRVGSDSIMGRLEANRPKRVSWSRMMQVMQAYNHEMAEELQLLVVEMQERSRLRPHVSTKRWETATLNEGNAAFWKNGFGVGVPKYLDESVAKYWRQIDEGYSGHALQHRIMYGVFGENLGPAAGFASGPGYYGAPAWSWVGQGGRDGKFSPNRRGADGHYGPPDGMPRPHKLAARGGFARQRATTGSTRFEIKKAIAGQHMYARAWDAYRRTNRPFQLFRQVVLRELGAQLGLTKLPNSVEGVLRLL